LTPRDRISALNQPHQEPAAHGFTNVRLYGEVNTWAEQHRSRTGIRWLLNCGATQERTATQFCLSLFLFLKCLLVSRLIWFTLSPFISLGSCNHCSFACFLWSNNFEHPSSNHDLWFGRIRTIIRQLRNEYV
jgi:hypothetical protein